jgi:hypothetical protein
MEHQDKDLFDVARKMRFARERVDEVAAPVRARLEALGPAGLFALAAEEDRLAAAALEPARRALHLDASQAAQTLGEYFAGQRARGI